MKLTHLSLTGVVAFLRPDLEPFCREAPVGMLLSFVTVSSYRSNFSI